MSRLKALVAAGSAPSFPSVDAEHVLGYLFEVGPVMVGAMGEAPLSHAELAAWQANVGIVLQPWEARFLRSLSIEYLVQAQQAEKPECPAPYGSLERRALVAKRIDEVFG